VDELLTHARPDLYRRNAFRVLGLPIDAGSRELTRRRKRMERAALMGKELPPAEGAYLPLDSAPNEEELQAAVQVLADPMVRLFDELFWFGQPSGKSTLVDQGLEILRTQGAVAAQNLWAKGKKSQVDHQVRRAQAILHHVRALDLELKSWKKDLSKTELEDLVGHWKNALRCWSLAIEDDGLWSDLKARVAEINDPRLKSGLVRRLRSSLPRALLTINARLVARAAAAGQTDDVQRHLLLMRGAPFPGALVDSVLEDALLSVRDRLTLLRKPIEDLKDYKQADGPVLELLEKSKPLLEVMDSVLSMSSSMRTAAHDAVALTCLDAIIGFGNASENWRRCAEVLPRIAPICGTDSTRERLEHNKRIIETNVALDGCFFCEVGEASDAAKLEYAMYGDVTQDALQINWRHTKVQVPRCAKCKKYHDGAEAAGCTSGLLGVGGVIASVWYGNTHYWSTEAMFAAAVGGVALAIALWVALNPKKHHSSVKGLGTHDGHPRIKELKAKGWAFGERPQTQS
jgi:hypothetical protein